MARSTETSKSVAEGIAQSGGLAQFRTVAARRDEADGPFGPPTERRRKRVGDAPQPEPAPPTPQPPSSPVRDEPSEAADAAQAADRAEPVAEPLAPTENITVPFSEDLRDRSERCAKVLSRSRSIRKRRITRNSVIRVATELFLDEFALDLGESINSEEELLARCRARRSERTRTASPVAEPAGRSPGRLKPSE